MNILLIALFLAVLLGGGYAALFLTAVVAFKALWLIAVVACGYFVVKTLKRGV